MRRFVHFMITIVLVACSLSGCYGWYWEDLRDCTCDELVAINQSIWMAENVYLPEAETRFDNELWSGNPVDFQAILEKLDNTSYQCGVAYLSDPVEDPNVEGEYLDVPAAADWTKDTITINIESFNFVSYQERYFTAPNFVYGNLSNTDKLNRMYWGGHEEYLALNQEAVAYYESPGKFSGQLVHEGWHLAVGEDSRHDYEPGESHLYDTDPAQTLEDAFAFTASDLAWAEQENLGDLNSLVVNGLWEPEEEEDDE